MKQAWLDTNPSGTVANLARAMRACPDTIFLGHAPGFWREISGDAETETQMYPNGPVTEGGKLWQLFEEYPNLYGDLSAGSGLSALKRDPKHAKKFIAAFADRLLFARDYYGGDLYDFLETLALPTAVRDKIYSQNALKLTGDIK
jgi:predicted TIM-barrel fold metal-dependent hydrolase